MKVIGATASIVSQRNQARVFVAAAAAALLAGLVGPGAAGAVVLSTSTLAMLSGSALNARTPSIGYTASFGQTFTGVDEVDYQFQFGANADVLNPNECLEITGGFPMKLGFCNTGASSQTSRVLTVPCATFPDVCAAYQDGLDTGQVTISGPNKSKPAVKITSLQVAVVAAYTCPAGQVCIQNGAV